MQIFATSVNRIVGVILTIINDLIVVSMILCNFVMVRFHHRLNWLSFSLFFTVAVATLIYLVLSHIKLGEVNSLSVKMIKSLKRKEAGMSPSERKLMRKYTKSFKPLQVRLGVFGYFRKPNTLVVVGKLVKYTLKFILMTNPLF